MMKPEINHDKFPSSSPSLNKKDDGGLAGLLSMTDDPSHRMFDHPLLPSLPESSRTGQEEDKKRNYSHSEDEDHLNGVVGRSIAETSFIRVPGSSSKGSSSSFCSKGQKESSLLGHKTKTISEEFHDLDHEVSEITPFCRTHESTDE